MFNRSFHNLVGFEWTKKCDPVVDVIKLFWNLPGQNARQRLFLATLSILFEMDNVIGESRFSQKSFITSTIGKENYLIKIAKTNI